ncbi:DUF3037 domain-containing protein [Rheinheimera sp.]|uniref:DUF3037 domain-containing protein n=1 Tax=Rheinheimera sp. TaxID=1869214 RepID=UPI00307E2EC3
MKTLYQYAIVRFLPHAETGEFANVGIVLCAPDHTVFEFRLAPTRFARITDFFEDVQGKLYKTAIDTVQQELKRLHAYMATLQPKELVATMQELVRPRETLVRYSDLRTMYIDKKPAELADQLFEQLVHRTFLTEAYQEQLLVKAIRAQLKTEKLTHFKQQQLTGRFDEITLPLVAKTNDTFVIRPLAFQHKNAGKILDHAQTWLGRFTRLEQDNVLKKDHVLLPLQAPIQTDRKLAGAFAEVQREFDQLGLHTIAHNDHKAITAFARHALTADGFQLIH